MMVMKGDTLVYDANAFQLAEGSMLDELIRQLPGVRLESGGRITLTGTSSAACWLMERTSSTVTPK